MGTLLDLSFVLLARTDSLGASDPTGTGMGDFFIDLLIIASLLGAVIHMIYKMRQSYFKPITVDEMKLRRLKDNEPEDSDESENQLAWQYLDQVFDQWEVVTEPGEEELRAPTTHRDLNDAKDILDQAIEVGPTDPDIVHRINELGEVLNSNASRKFAGSKALMLVAAGLAVFVAFTTKGSDESWLIALLNVYYIWFGILFYFFASRAPLFLIDKRNRRIGNMNISSGLVGFFVGLFFGAPTYDTITKYRNGSSSRSTSLNLIGLILMIVGLMILGSAILFFGILNYLRNFILYI